nr:hypothetical protein [Bacilli bacterium]
MRKLYSLVKISESRVETPIVLDGILEIKNSLDLIDRFTSKFTYDELFANLNLEEGSKLYIKYVYNKEYKYLPIITKENDKFLIFTKENLNDQEEKIYTDDFDTYINRIIKFVSEHSDCKYLDYLVDHKYITAHVKDRIYEYIAIEAMEYYGLKDLDDKIPNKVAIMISLKKHLGSYKQLRDWYFGTKAFIVGEEKINGRLSASEYPTQYEECYHQCTIDETCKSLNLKK